MIQPLRFFSPLAYTPIYLQSGESLCCHGMVTLLQNRVVWVCI